MKLKYLFLILIVCIASTVISGCTSSEGSHLTIAVPDESVRDDLSKLVANSSNQLKKIDLIISPKNDTTSWLKEKKPDIIICDMHDISKYAHDGTLEPLNPVLSNGTTLNWTSIERPALLLYGEYPSRSGKIYALPFDPDALGIIYRHDLLADEGEMMAFCQTYGHELSIPGSYHELQDIARYFNRPEKNLSGIGFTGINGKDRDENPFRSILASEGGMIQDPATGKINGFLNGEALRNTADIYRNLSQFSLNGSDTWSGKELADAFVAGNVTMAFIWISDSNKITASQNNSELYSVMPLPGDGDPSGGFNRGIQVRGLSVGLSSSTSHREEALSFLEWFYSPGTQLQWMKAGHQPVITQTLNSYAYLSNNINNRLYPESIRIGVDLWHSPRFDAMSDIWYNSLTTLLSNETPDFSSFNKDVEKLDIIREQS